MTHKAMQSAALLVVWMLFTACLTGGSSQAEEVAYTDRDRAYVETFQKAIPPRSEWPPLAEYATVDDFDERFLGEQFEKQFSEIDNYEARLAWNLSYIMMAYNEMYRATGERRYLETMARAAQLVLAARDDRREIPLWTGEVAPVWSCGKYDDRGRCAYPVHTGIITYPILDFLTLAAGHREYREQMGPVYGALVEAMGESLKFHDVQWVEGPGEGEGHYIARNQEQSIEGEALAINRQNAMGRSLWLYQELTGDPEARRKALAIGHYFKNRVSHRTDIDAYIWSYNLYPDHEPARGDAEAVKEAVGVGEDISHGVLTLAYPVMLAEAGQVWDEQDVQRFANILLHSVADLPEDALHVMLGGHSRVDPSAARFRVTSRWLRLAPHEPAVFDRISRFLRRYVSPPEALDIAMLLKFEDLARD